MRKKVGKVVILSLAISLMAMGGGKAAIAGKNEIVFGYSAPLTGNMAYHGELTKKGYQTWADMVNAQGGIYVGEKGKKMPVRLVFYDDKFDPSTAARAYERLLTQDKVDFLLSPWGSSTGFAVSQVVQKYKVPTIFVWISSDPIYKQGYDYVFGLMPPASRHAWSSIDVLVDKKVMKAAPPKKLFIITPKQLYPMTTAKGAFEHAKNLGFEAYYEEVEKGVKDFTPVITKMKSMGIDGVVNTVHYGELFEFFRQCMEFNFRPDFLYTTGADVAEFLELFGAKAIEGVCVKGIWDPNWKTYGNKEFCEAYKKKWGEDANHYSSIAPAGQVMQQAIEKAGSLDREGVKKVLEEGEFESQLYPVKYVNEHGYTNINKLAFIGAQQWQAGKLLFVYPDLVAQAKFAYPMRWEK